ncbi:hypothetical protein K438DRAFT_970803 [Mycena galopus ATCC 62051]|nr:hypothetical protein K438DRAFT_970803 [Mycena galopus ATCC 62051]
MHPEWTLNKFRTNFERLLPRPDQQFPVLDSVSARFERPGPASHAHPPTWNVCRVLRTPAFPLLTHVHPLRTHLPSHFDRALHCPPSRWTSNTSNAPKPSLAPCPRHTPAHWIHFERVPNALPPLPTPALLRRIPLTSARFECPPTLPAYFERRHRRGLTSLAVLPKFSPSLLLS